MYHYWNPKLQWILSNFESPSKVIVTTRCVIKLIGAIRFGITFVIIWLLNVVFTLTFDVTWGYIPAYSILNVFITSIWIIIAGLCTSDLRRFVPNHLSEASDFATLFRAACVVVVVLNLIIVPSPLFPVCVSSIIYACTLGNALSLWWRCGVKTSRIIEGTFFLCSLCMCQCLAGQVQAELKVWGVIM